MVSLISGENVCYFCVKSSVSAILTLTDCAPFKMALTEDWTQKQHTFVSVHYTMLLIAHALAKIVGSAITGSARLFQHSGLVHCGHKGSKVSAFQAGGKKFLDKFIASHWSMEALNGYYWYQ